MPCKRRYNPHRGVDTWLVIDDITGFVHYNDQCQFDYKGNLTKHPQIINPQELPRKIEEENLAVPDPRGRQMTGFVFNPYVNSFVAPDHSRYGFIMNFITDGLRFEEEVLPDEDRAIYFWISSDNNPAVSVVIQPLIDMDSSVRQELPQNDMLSWMIPNLVNKRMIIAYKTGSINLVSFDFGNGFNQLGGFQKIPLPAMHPFNNTEYDIWYSRFIDHDSAIINIHAHALTG